MWERTDEFETPVALENSERSHVRNSIHVCLIFGSVVCCVVVSGVRFLDAHAEDI